MPCGVKYSLRKLHDLSIADLRPIYFSPTGFPVFLLATHDAPSWWLRDFLDGQQIVGRVVAVGGSAIFSALVDKPADCVPLEVMADGGRSFGAFYTCPEMGWRVVVPYDFLRGVTTK